MAGDGRPRSPVASSLIVVATQSGLAQYDRTLFSLHVVQHMLLGMVAPLLLVLGAPGHAGAPGLPSPGAAAAPPRAAQPAVHGSLTHPAVVWVLFGGTLVVLYFTGLYELSLRNDAVHALVHAHFVVVGFLFMGYVVGIDSFAFGFGYGARLLYVLVLLPFHAFIGVALLGSDHVLASGWYSQVVRSWGASRARRPATRRRESCGAPASWSASVALAIVLYQWMRHEEREGARLDRRLDAEQASQTRVAVVPH